MQSHNNNADFREDESANVNADEAILLMGEYIVIDKNNTNIQTIKSPGIQTCITVVIENSKFIAAAHIDNAITAERVIHNIMRRFGTEGGNSYKAELVGGDVSILNQGSEQIRKTICHALKVYDIPFSHKYCSYYIPDVILPSMYLALRLFNIVGPESYVKSAITLGVIYGVNNISNYVFQNTFDLYIDTKSGMTEVIKNDSVNSLRLFQMVTPLQKQRVFDRHHLNPKTTHESLLELQRHPYSLKL